MIGRLCVRGFTTFELLVASLIAILLLGILLPALSNSRKRAHLTNNISNLRQIGIAHHLYTENYGASLYSCYDLVTKNALNPNIALSHLDDTATGLAKYIRAMYGLDIENPHKITYLGISDFSEYNAYLSELEETGAPGWLVDPVEIEFDRASSESILTGKGKYRRLLMDGSVVTRNYSMLPVSVDGREMKFTTPSLLFFDPSQEWLSTRSQP